MTTIAHFGMCAENESEACGMGEEQNLGALMPLIVTAEQNVLSQIIGAPCSRKHMVGVSDLKENMSTLEKNLGILLE